MPGTAARPEGITNPPIDELLDTVDNKYGLVLYSAKRARQINAYYCQLGEGLLEYVGPLVETHVQEKPLSIALREINAGLLTLRARRGDAVRGLRPAPMRVVAVQSPSRVVLGVSGGIAAYKACELLRRLHRVRARRHASSRRAAALRVRRRGHLGGAVRPAGDHRRVGRRRTRSRTCGIGQHADLVARRPGHRRPDGPGGARPGRRPAHQHPAHRPLPGRVRARDAHRDVGAPGHPGQRRDAARAAASSSSSRPSGRLTGADTGTGRLPEPGRDLRGRPATCSPAASPAARPGRPARRGLRRRHPRAPRPGALPRQPLVAAGRATRWPVRRPPAAPRSPSSPPTSPCPTRPASRSSGCETTAELRRRRARAAAPSADAVVMAAAPADFRPVDVSATKIKKADDGARPAARARAEPRHPRRARRTTGSARAGRRRLRRRDRRRHRAPCSTLGRAKLARKGCDLLVVNDVSGGRGLRQRRQRGRRPRRRRRRPPRCRAAPRPRWPT